MKNIISNKNKQLIKTLFLPKREFPSQEIKFKDKTDYCKLDANVRVNDNICFPGNFITKFNSTYFEMVDGAYTYTKTKASFISLVFFVFVLAMCFYIYFNITLLLKSFSIFISLFICFLFCLLCVIYSVFNLSFFRTYFTYTHNPIRFNRKEQLVHFYCRNGKQISTPWENIIFTCEEAGQFGVYFLGNVIDKETGIIKYRISIPPTDDSSSMVEYANGLKTYPQIAATYRFILEYMEGKNDDIPKLRKLIYSCLHIEQRKESPYWSTLICLRMFDPVFKTFYQPFSFLSQLLLTPIFLPFRVLSILTCKRPIWGEEIEHLCQIEKNDPNEIDGRKNPKGFTLFRYAVGYLTLKEYSQLIRNIDEASQLNIPSSNIKKNN